ncbi:MAG TPA: hypothetical protein VHB01_02385 [Nitrosospira sp.]|nr:hypothetical protein [Nitrosospira sp.]
MKNLKHFFFSCLAAAMVALAFAGPAASFDGGAGDGGGDDGGLDEGGDQGDHSPDGDGHADDGGGNHGQEHHGGHGGDRHHGHHVGHRDYYGGYGWGWGPGFSPYGFGAFGYFPPYYPPFQAYPRIAVQPAAPPVYIEQQNSAAAPATSAQSAASYWHYCRAEGGYYPDVKECPDGWMQIPPLNQSVGQSTSPEQAGQP